MIAKRLHAIAAVLATACCLTGLASPAAAQAEEKVLNIYNWSDYIGDGVIAKFEKETGIKVRYDVFDNNEIVHAKMVAGKTGYDIVVPSSNWAKLQIDGGLVQKLDKSRIPNLKNLDAAMQAQLATMDPGNEHMVNWMWGFTTVGINVDKVKAALGGKLPDNVWDLLFKPEIVSKLKGCGVSFLDSATEVVPAALHYIGKSAYSKRPADYSAALQALKAVRPHVTLFSSSGYINDMANGSICVAMGWSGDINIARQRAIDGKTGQNIEALIPANGGLLFFDMMVIPADAEHPGNAHKFIDFILRPENAGANTNKVFYPNPVPASRQHIRADVANNPTVFLSPQDMAKMVPPEAINNDLRRLMTRTFTAFKTGL
jgi:putrescine transport system substrate-binding protein